MSHRPATDPDPGLTAAAAFLEEHAVHTVDVTFSDLWGQLCARQVPTAHFLARAGSGFAFPVAPFTWSVRGDIAPSPLANADNGWPNLRFEVDVETLRPAPWNPGFAFCLGTARGHDGTEHPLDGRGQVRRATARLAQAGHEALVAAELEFHLCAADWSPLYTGRRPFALGREADAEPILTEVRRCLDGCGLVVESSQTEYGDGQYEVNIGPSDPLTAADHAAILKHVVKAVARRHGARATFMPAPVTGGSTSGLHIHQSLRADGGVLPAYLAGLLERLAELTAVMSPSINAYKRLRPEGDIADRACWDHDNRGAAVRALGDGEETSRLELRTPSSDANPYLVIAACLAAGADGLRRDATPPPATPGASSRDDAAPRLPRSLADAVGRFEASAFAREAFGDELVDTLVAVQRLELERFAVHTTDWERDRYLEDA